MNQMTKPVAAATENSSSSARTDASTVEIQPLTDVFVSLDSIQPGLCRQLIIKSLCGVYFGCEIRNACVYEVNECRTICCFNEMNESMNKQSFNVSADKRMSASAHITHFLVYQICMEEGVSQMRTSAEKGEGGVKNHQIFADILYGWPLTPK